MFLSDLSIKRPVLAAVLMLALVTLGLFSYKRLAVDMYPDVEIPVISIITKYTGASPETVEREISKKIEEAVNPIAGVKHVISYSREGISNIVIIFNLEVKINDVVQEARAKINAIRGDLPEDIEEPIIQKMDAGGMAVASIAVSSEKLSPKELTSIVDKKIKKRFENLSGVGKINVAGSSSREIVINIIPEKIEALGIGINEIAAGLKRENVNTPLGRITSSANEYAIRVSGKPKSPEEFKELIIAVKNNLPIKLSDVAIVSDAMEEPRSIALVNGKQAVALDILKQSGANTVELVKKVEKTVEKMKSELPQDVKLEIVRNASVMIEDSVKDVQETLVIGGILTIFIVFIFLNSWRSTVITGLTLPISVISSFIIMNFMNMTLNVMTLMALSLAIGLLIDDAIVVRENIVRHLEKDNDHFKAAKDGTAEIGLAVLATTLSIVSVFVPVAFMKGIVGRFFFQFGITVAFAVLVSLLVSFTLDPMLSSRWHDPDIGSENRRNFISKLLSKFNSWFDYLSEKYQSVISWALNHRKTILLLATLAFISGMVLMGKLESAFMTKFDQGEFQVNFTSSTYASFYETKNRMDKVLSTIHSMKEVERTYGTIGVGDSGTVKDAMVYVKLVDKKMRDKDQFQIEKETRKKLQQIAGINFSILKSGDLRGEKELMVNLRGEDTSKLKEYGAKLKDELYKIRGIVDIEMTMEHDSPEYRLMVDREKIYKMNLTTSDVVNTVSTLVGGTVPSTFEDEDGDAVDIRVRLPENLRNNPEQVENLKLALTTKTGESKLVQLGSVAKYTYNYSPSVINRQDLSREITISASLENLPLGTAIQQVQKATEKLNLPQGYRVVFSGEAEDMQETFMYMAEALMLAIIFVYLILAAQFESFIDPLSIMLSLPLSIVGMAGMLYLTHDTVNIMSLIGLIMLMGLVTKNAILLIDYTKTLRKGGMNRIDALILAGKTRLRPIMMTTFAMIFGMLPLAMALGSGAEMRAPMARAVIGGLITSTLLTLIVVPVVYTMLEDTFKFTKKIFRKNSEA